MPEFRQNLATKEWVILAPERGRRPHEFRNNDSPIKPPPPHNPECPFCPGNESRTENPLYTFPEIGPWQVRVVPNKFAALKSHLTAARHQVGAFLAADGFGLAEVVIEHPRHDLSPATMSLDEVTAILRAYRERQREISRHPDINLVTIFRNHGSRAGTSLEHPHSQIIATPIVPPHVRYPIEQAVLYFDQHGRCVFCDMVKEEIRQGTRLIRESENFVAFCPFAARSPFECRLYPKKHQPAFMLLDDTHLAELALILKDTLGRLSLGLNNPDYNYILRSAPVGDDDTRHLHWYMVIVPKISIPAGFEIGSGIYINTVPPEDAAAYLRKTAPEI